MAAATACAGCSHAYGITAPICRGSGFSGILSSISLIFVFNCCESALMSVNEANSKRHTCNGQQNIGQTFSKFTLILDLI